MFVVNEKLPHGLRIASRPKNDTGLSKIELRLLWNRARKEEASEQRTSRYNVMLLQVPQVLLQRSVGQKRRRAWPLSTQTFPRHCGKRLCLLVPRGYR